MNQRKCVINNKEFKNLPPTKTEVKEKLLSEGFIFGSDREKIISYPDFYLDATVFMQKITT